MVGRLLSFLICSLFLGTCFFCVCNLSTYMHQNNFKQTHVQTQTLKQSTNHEGPPKNPYPKAKPPGKSKEWIDPQVVVVDCAQSNFHLRNSVTSMLFGFYGHVPIKKNIKEEKTTSVVNYPFLTKVWSSNFPVPHGNCCGKNGASRTGCWNKEVLQRILHFGGRTHWKAMSKAVTSWWWSKMTSM